MQYLARLASKLLFCVGIMITVVSCVLSSALESGINRGPFIGIALMIIAAVLWQKTSKQKIDGEGESGRGSKRE